jgi:hypothetical protein
MTQSIKPDTLPRPLQMRLPLILRPLPVASAADSILIGPSTNQAGTLAKEKKMLARVTPQTPGRNHGLGTNIAISKHCMRGPSGLAAHSPKFNLPSPPRALRDLATPFDELCCPCDNNSCRPTALAFRGVWRGSVAQKPRACQHPRGSSIRTPGRWPHSQRNLNLLARNAACYGQGGRYGCLPLHNRHYRCGQFEIGDCYVHRGRCLVPMSSSASSWARPTRCGWCLTDRPYTMACLN